MTREIAGAWELFGCDFPDGAATIYHDYFAPIVSAAARRRNASSIKRPLAKREGTMRLNGKAAIARTEPSRLPG